MSDSGIISNYVRNWVHYDNLASSFYKQSLGARKIKDEFEDKIIQHLTHNNMQNAVIQTSNGRITLNDEKKPNQLSLSKIEELLHQYYRANGGRDETLQIIQFIRGNRGYEARKCLRKSNAIPQQIPPIPPIPPMMPQLQ